MLNRRLFSFSAAAMALQLNAAKEPPIRSVKVKKLFRAPEGHPNAMETVPEGVWIGEQVSDAAYLMDWKGKILRKVPTESSNTSGIAYGDGHLWMAANGKALWRDAKPTDTAAGAGQIVKADVHTGKTVARYDVPGSGGVHGVLFSEGTLWITTLKQQKLTQVNPKTFEIIRQIPCKLGRAHGLDIYKGFMWCMFSNDRQIHKMDMKDGTVLEIIQLGKDDPDPHGMCIYNGHLHYCDAGIAPSGKPNNSADAGWVCRIEDTI